MSIRLNLEYDREFFEKDEREWKTFVWYENKCGYTKLNDNDTECHPQLQDGVVVTHFLSACGQETKKNDDRIIYGSEKR